MTDGHGGDREREMCEFVRESERAPRLYITWVDAPLAGERSTWDTCVFRINNVLPRAGLYLFSAHRSYPLPPKENDFMAALGPSTWMEKAGWMSGGSCV
jgi:hypothetical protein